VRLFYGMEDNLRANGPSVASVLLSPSWQPLTLMWRPPALSPDARLYFWTMGPARFELRGIRLTNLGSGAVRPVTTRLRGRFHNLRRALAERERRFIQSREGAARIAWHAFVTHPAFGVGWERFPAYAASRSGVGQIASHDDYLRFAAELGIPGLLALLCLCLAVGWAALRARSARWAPAALGVLAAGAVDVAFANILSVPEVTLPVATAAAAVAAAATRTGSLRSAWSRT
jgi:hypothetical protein